MPATLEIIQQRELARVREKVSLILHLASTENSFRQQATSDPAEVLRAFGLPEDALLPVAHPTDGHLIESTSTAHLYDICPLTCHVTLVTFQKG